MNAAIQEVKTKKEINTDLILAAVNNNKPITIKAYSLNQSTQDFLWFTLRLILEKYNKSESMEVCYNSVKSLVVNAMKANIKRVLFTRMGLDIANPKDYAIGMEKIGKNLSENNFPKFKDELMKQKLSVNITFNYNTDGFSITVKSPFLLLPHEYEQNLKLDIEKPRYLSIKPVPKDINSNSKDSRDSKKVVSLNQYKSNQQILSQSSNPETNETLIKLDIVLKEKDIFNKDTFGQEIDALDLNYREKLKEVIDGKQKEEKTYQTISRDFATSIRGKGDFLNQLNRINSLDSQFYKEQQLLLANYGENVFKTIENKLQQAKTESTEFIGQIQKIGKEVYDLNKNQIESFIESRDFEIEKQTNQQIDKHKKKIENLNASLDLRIENQTVILNGQVNELLDQLNQSTIQLLESTEQEISKLDSIFETKSNILKNQVKRHLEEMSKSSNELIESTKEEIFQLDSIIENKSVSLKDQVKDHLEEITKANKNAIESSREEISQFDSILAEKSNQLKEQVNQYLKEIADSSHEVISSTKVEVFDLNSILTQKSISLKEQVKEHLEEITKSSQNTIESAREEISKFDSKIESQSEILKNKVNRLLEEMNTSSSELIDSTWQEVSKLDVRIENKSNSIKEQVNEHIEQLTKSGNDFIFTTNQEISKFKDNIKLELDSELNLAEIRKNDILMEINTEKLSLENSLRNIKEEIQTVQKFRTNKEVMDSFAKLSDEAFWRMSSNIELIQEKEEKINQFVNNIKIFESSIRNTEDELKRLDFEKADYLTKKGDVVQSIDSKIKLMEKFGDEMKEKLIEISGFERKLNIISGSLTEQVKKAKLVDEQLSKFNREVFALETKRRDLNHFVNDVDQKVDLINSRSADIKIMESKYNNIERMMIDLSARHKQITTMESRLEDVKSHIENLLMQAENKISQMNLTMQSTKRKKAKVRRKKNFPIV